MCSRLFRATPQSRTPTGRHLVRKPTRRRQTLQEPTGQRPDATGTPPNVPPVSIRHIGSSWPVEKSDLGGDRAGTTDHASKVRGCVVVPNPSPCHPVCLKKAPLWRYAECRLVLEEKVVGYRRGGKFLLQFGQTVFGFGLDVALRHCDTNAMYRVVAVSIAIPDRRQRLGLAGLVTGAGCDHVCSCSERRIDRPRSRGKTPSTRS